jgi:glutamate-1-semialdehyde 2,1-aminomutase
VVGTLIGVFFGDAAVVDYAGAKASAATGQFPRLMHGLLDRGVAIAPGAYEILFPGLAHGTAEIDLVVGAVAEVAEEMASR